MNQYFVTGVSESVLICTGRLGLKSPVSTLESKPFRYEGL
jgi:hypothetical protein